MVASQLPYIMTGTAVRARASLIARSIGYRPKAEVRYTIVSNEISNLRRAIMRYQNSSVAAAAGSATASNPIAQK